MVIVLLADHFSPSRRNAETMAELVDLNELLRDYRSKVGGKYEEAIIEHDPALLERKGRDEVAFRMDESNESFRVRIPPLYHGVTISDPCAQQFIPFSNGKVQLPDPQRLQVHDALRFLDCAPTSLHLVTTSFLDRVWIMRPTTEPIRRPTIVPRGGPAYLKTQPWIETKDISPDPDTDRFLVANSVDFSVWIPVLQTETNVPLLPENVGAMLFRDRHPASDLRSASPETVYPRLARLGREQFAETTLGDLTSFLALTDVTSSGASVSVGFVALPSRGVEAITFLMIVVLLYLALLLSALERNWSAEVSRGYPWVGVMPDVWALIFTMGSVLFGPPLAFWLATAGVVDQPWKGVLLTVVVIASVRCQFVIARLSRDKSGSDHWLASQFCAAFEYPADRLHRIVLESKIVYQAAHLRLLSTVGRKANDTKR